MENTQNLKLPYLLPSQAQKHVTHNEALATLDALVQLSVVSRSLSNPPASPGDGQRYIVAPEATGAWSSQAGRVASWQDGAWVFHAPLPGWLAWVVGESTLVYWTGSMWAEVSEATAALQNLSLIGVGTTADLANPFSAKLNKALWTARYAQEGGDGDLRYTMNKEGVSDTLSILMQCGYSARAEIGLTGDNDLSLKVSSDGSLFRTAISANGNNGKVKFPFGVSNTRPANIVMRKQVTSAAWPSSASAMDNNWVSVCWSPELAMFAAVSNTGSGDRVMTSFDGIDWDIRSSGADNGWIDICWSPRAGCFCVVGNTGTGNRVMTSPDGVTWSTQASAANNSWRGICWSPELHLFCAVADTGTGNRVMTSPDGAGWTAHAAAAENDWRAVCWSSDLGLFCAVGISGSGNRVMTSPDGGTWTARASAADNNWVGVCWSSELGSFAAVSNSGAGNRVMTSPDGITWNSQASVADNGWNDIVWAPEIGLFAAIANSGANRIMTSPDGVTWTLGDAVAANTWAGLCWSPELGLFCAVANSGSGNRAMTSLSAYSVPYRSS